jgi:CheY-like chemotaxis protein
MPRDLRNRQPLLVVEDDADHLDLTLKALACALPGIPIEVARDGEEALQLLAIRRRHGVQPPALILLDLQLARLDGLATLAQLRATEATRALVVVVLTSSTEQRDIARAYALGANSYIHKPIDYKQFRQLVADVSRYWLELNVPAPA